MQIKIIKRKYLLLLLIVSKGIVFSQNSADWSQKIIPSSPTASSLGLYGEKNANLYTGSNNISIPIYNIKINDFNLPISLNYNSATIKVAQDASWVGMNWSLASGGVVTRTVRGIDDFSPAYGYYYYNNALPVFGSDNKYETPTDNPLKDYDYFKNVFYGNYDGEPDIYSYNFGSYSGKFTIGRKTDGSIVFQSENNNLIITFDDSNINLPFWTINTPDGTIYKFCTQELSQYTSYSTENAEYYKNTGGLGNINNKPKVISSWFLDEIRLSNGEIINFSYKNGKSYSVMNKSETRFDLLYLNRISNDYSVPKPWIYNILFPLTWGQSTINQTFINGGSSSKHDFYTSSRQEIDEVYLSEINFKNGVIKIATSDREDIEPFPNSEKPQKIDSISLFDKSNNIVNSWKFVYFYSNNGEDFTSKRLFLKEFKKRGNSITFEQVYKFDYYNSTSIPSKYSKNMDYWGFFNNPPYDIFNPNPYENSTILQDVCIKDVPLKGGYLEPDPTPSMPQTGLMSKIQYPTGGYSKFEYETNTFDRANSRPSIKIQPVSAGITYDYEFNTYEPFSQRFTTNTNSIAEIYAWGYKNDSGPYTGPVPTGEYLGALIKDGVFYRYISAASSHYTYSLPPGNYELKPTEVYSNTEINITMNVREESIINLDYGGGVRLKSISDFVDNNIVSGKKYIYTLNGEIDGATSGILLNPVNQAYTVNVTEDNSSFDMGVISQREVVFKTYLCRQTSSLFPTGFNSSGITVGYSKVTELDYSIDSGLSNFNGKTTYIYNNSIDKLASNFILPGCPTTGNPLNGKIDSKIIYDEENNILSETKYTYDIQDNSRLMGILTYGCPIDQSSNTTGVAPKFYMQSYYNQSNRVMLTNEIKKEKFNSEFITRQINYTYENPYKTLSKKEEIMNENKSIVSVYKYPFDFINIGTAYSKMTTMNMISPVIEQKDYVKELNKPLKLINGIFREYTDNEVINQSSIYKFNNSNLSITPEISFNSNGEVIVSDFISNEITFDKYHNWNLLEMHNKTGLYTTILWGYNNQYPIAEIKNATYTEVSAALNGITPEDLSNSLVPDMSKVEDLRQSPNLAKAIITTYTYKPLVGISTMTDPRGVTTYYEYDDFNRLKESYIIENGQKKIVQKYDYHNANQ